MLSDRFKAALFYATDLHANDRRNATSIPYISHPLAVCSLVLEAGGDEDQAIAALLHDAAEDHGGQARLDDINEHFGARVMKIVAACTDFTEPVKPPWRERKQRHLEHLKTAPPEVLVVSLADKLHNARTVLADYRVHGATVWQRFQGGKEYATWYEAELARIFQERSPGPMANELQHLVAMIAAAEPEN